MNDVTATQAAVLTGLSERTIRRKIASGEIPARRLAPNRFAIQVRDLPVRPQLDIEALAARLAALEQRVARLEALPLTRSRARRADITGAAESAEAASVPLRELVAQLSHELEQLSPLLSSGGGGSAEIVTAPMPVQAVAGGAKGGRRRRLRSVMSTSQDEQQSNAQNG